MITQNRQKWEQEGAEAPLFDRLIDTYPTELTDRPNSVDYTKSQVIDSIIRDVTLLLNTRCVLTLESYNKLNPGTLTYGIPELYGIPDFSAFNPSAVLSWDQSAGFIKNAIRIFEPRLTHVRVDITRFDEFTQELYAEITGKAIIGKYIEPVKFPVSIENIPINKVPKKG